jgi:DNA-directed RNA polymerase specialized sigma24 family protein
VLAMLHTVEARDDLVTRLQAAFDQELLERAMDLVRDRVEPRTWEAFRLTAVNGLSAAEAGEKLDMRMGTVYQARSSVQRLLRETLAELNPDESG